MSSSKIEKKRELLTSLNELIKRLVSLSEDAARLEIADNLAAAKRLRMGLIDTEKQMKDFRNKIKSIKFDIRESKNNTNNSQQVKPTQKTNTMGFVSKKNSNFWDPRKDDSGKEKINAEANDFIDGYYLSMEENQGKDKNSRLYTIMPKEGDALSIWGTFLLDEQMGKVPLGAYVRIQWLGKKQPKTPAGRPFHDWEVFHDVDVPLHASIAHKAPSAAEKLAPAPVENTAAAIAKTREEEDDLPF